MWKTTSDSFDEQFGELNRRRSDTEEDLKRKRWAPSASLCRVNPIHFILEEYPAEFYTFVLLFLVLLVTFNTVGQTCKDKLWSMDARSFLLSLAVLLLCRFLRAQQQLMPGSCNFELGTCGYTSDPEYGSWSMNEEGTVSSLALLIDRNECRNV